MSDVMAANPQHYNIGGFSYGTLCNATASPVPPSQMGVCELFNQELIEKEDELSLIMLIDKLRSAADFHELKEIPDDYFENISRDSPQTLLKLISKIVAAFLHRLNIPKEEIGTFTDQIENKATAIPLALDGGLR